MEIFEVLWAIVQGCGCFLELFAASSSAAAGAAAYQANKDRKARKAAQAEGTQPPSRLALWLFLAFLFLAVFSAGLIVWKWVRGQ